MAAGNVTGLLQKNDDPEVMLREVMSDFELEILEKTPIEYRCYCSRERFFVTPRESHLCRQKALSS